MMNPAKSTVLQRSTRTRPASLTGPRASCHGSTKSRAKLVPSAFSAVLSEPIAVAMMPATTKPRMPAGICVRMKKGNASRSAMPAGSAAWPLV